MKTFMSNAMTLVGIKNGRPLSPRIGDGKIDLGNLYNWCFKQGFPAHFPINKPSGYSKEEEFVSGKHFENPWDFVSESCFGELKVGPRPALYSANQFWAEQG